MTIVCSSLAVDDYMEVGYVPDEEPRPLVGSVDALKRCCQAVTWSVRFIRSKVVLSVLPFYNKFRKLPSCSNSLADK